MNVDLQIVAVTNRDLDTMTLADVRESGNPGRTSVPQLGPTQRAPSSAEPQADGSPAARST